MQALVRTRYGSPDRLSIRELPVPVPGPGEVRVRVRASSVNPADWFFLTGTPYPLRLLSGLLSPRHPVFGRDAAGVVDAVGDGVTRFQSGDEVFGEVESAYAEYVIAREDRLGPKPTNASFEEAAALPVAAITALQALRDKAHVRAGHRVLVNGASGGVGTFAVQIAKAFGAEVIGVCSARNAELVRRAGADGIVDYGREDFTATGPYDAILDLVGSRPLRACLRALRPTGVYVSSVGRLGWTLKSALASLLPGSRVRVVAAATSTEDLTALRDLYEAGKLRSLVDRRYSLGEAPEALRRQGAGHARGKSVISVTSARAVRAPRDP